MENKDMLKMAADRLSLVVSCAVDRKSTRLNPVT